MQEKFMAGYSNKTAIWVQIVVDDLGDVFNNGYNRSVYEYSAGIYAVG